MAILLKEYWEKQKFLKAISTVEQGGKNFQRRHFNVLVNNLLSSGTGQAREPSPITKWKYTFAITSKGAPKILELV